MPPKCAGIYLGIMCLGPKLHQRIDNGTEKKLSFVQHFLALSHAAQLYEFGINHLCFVLIKKCNTFVPKP